MCREANTAQGVKPSTVFVSIQPLSAVFFLFFVNTSIGSALSVVFYFLVFLLGAFTLLSQTASIFGDLVCLCNLFLVIEPTGRVSLASSSDLQCHAHDQSCCLSVLITFHT